MAQTTQSLALLARLMGQKFDVEVVVGNYSTASTDGKIIKIPLITGDEALEWVRGYIDHETGHIRYTDFNILPTRNFAGALLNIIEDTRVDKAQGRDFIGSVLNLRKLDALLDAKYGFGEPNPCDPSSILCNWVMLQGRVKILGHKDLTKSVQNIESIVKQILGSNYQEAERLLDKIGTLPLDKSGTQASADLRDEFMALLGKAHEEATAPPPPPSPEKSKPEENEKEEQNQEKTEEKSNDGQKQDTPSETDSEEDPETGNSGSGSEGSDTENEEENAGSDSQSNTESGTGSESSDPVETHGGDAASEVDADEDENGEGDTNGEANGESEGNTDPADGSTECGEGSADGAANENLKPDQPTNASNEGDHSPYGGRSEAEMRVIVETLLEALGNKPIEHKGVGELLQELLEFAAQQMDPTQTDAIPRKPECIPHPAKCSYEFPDLAKVRAHTAKLRAQLAGLVQASRLRRATPRRTGHKIDHRFLTRLRKGDDRLFIGKDEKKAVNTAFMLCLDGSSSMGKISPDNTKMYIAARSCFVAIEALYAIPGVKAAAIEFNDLHNQVMKLCSWGEKPDSKSFNHDSSSGTEISTALWSAWGELLARPETRKIAVIFSDGATAQSDVSRTLAALKRMKDDGIECVGIGIQDYNLKNYLPETKIIQDLSQLTPAILGLLQDKLLEAT